MNCLKLLSEKGVGFCGQPSYEFIVHNLFPIQISSSLFWFRFFFGVVILFVFAWRVRRSIFDAIVSVWVALWLFGVSSWLNSLILVNALLLSGLPTFLTLLISFSAGFLLPFKGFLGLLITYVLKDARVKVLGWALLLYFVGSFLSWEEIKWIPINNIGSPRELRLDKGYFDFIEIVDLRYLIRRPIFVLGFISLLLVQDWSKIKEQRLYLISLALLVVLLALKSFVGIIVCYLTLILLAFDSVDSVERKWAKGIAVMFFMERIFNIDSVANLFLPLSAVVRLFGSVSICHLLVILVLLNIKLGNRLGIYIIALVLSFSVDSPIFK